VHKLSGTPQAKSDTSEGHIHNPSDLGYTEASRPVLYDIGMGCLKRTSFSILLQAMRALAVRVCSRCSRAVGSARYRPKPGPGGGPCICVNNQIRLYHSALFSRLQTLTTDTPGVEAPIFPRQGEIEAVVHAPAVATEFRRSFHKDVVLDYHLLRILVNEATTMFQQPGDVTKRSKARPLTPIRAAVQGRSDPEGEIET